MFAKVKSLFNESITIPDILKNNYLPELDGLRGISIITVVLSHIFTDTRLSVFAVGNTGVEIFFVLSGFLITSRLLKEKITEGRVSLNRFYIRRALRILPVAYLFLAVLLLLNYFFRLKMDPGSFIASALFVRNFDLHYTSNWFNGHFWTLAIEEQFYLIFPVVIVYSIRNYVKVVFIIIIAVPILHVLYFNNVGIIHSNTVLHALAYLFLNLFQNGTASIFAGSILSILMFKNIIPGKPVTGKPYKGVILLLFALVFRCTCRNVINSNYITAIIFALLIMLIIYIVLTNQSDILSIILRNKWLIKLGILSYSLYIWQQPFVYGQPWKNQFKYADSLILNIPAMMLVAYCSYYFYELKFLKLKKHYK